MNEPKPDDRSAWVVQLRDYDGEIVFMESTSDGFIRWTPRIDEAELLDCVEAIRAARRAGAGAQAMAVRVTYERNPKYQAATDTPGGTP